MAPRTLSERTSPLVYPAALLSAASLVWTTWSLVDLLGTGLIGVTVAAGADIIWASVIVAEYRGLRIAGRRWAVPALGWLTLLTVAGFLAWHGIDRGVLAMAVAGPFLPLGAKAVWSLALADMRDPAALTDEERHVLARMERGMAFEEAQHRITMRRRAMDAELQITEVSTDFDIELTRREKTRELQRRRPLELDAAPADAAPRPEAPRAAPPAAPAQPALRPTTDDTQHGPTADITDLAGMSKADAVLRIKRDHPDATAPQLAQHLAAHGITAQPGYIRTVLGRERKKRGTPDGQGFYP